MNVVLIATGYNGCQRAGCKSCCLGAQQYSVHKLRSTCYLMAVRVLYHMRTGEKASTCLPSTTASVGPENMKQIVTFTWEAPSFITSSVLSFHPAVSACAVQCSCAEGEPECQLRKTAPLFLRSSGEQQALVCLGSPCSWLLELQLVLSPVRQSLKLITGPLWW